MEHDLAIAKQDLDYWTNVAPMVDFRVWSQARDFETAEKIRQECMREAKRYIRHLMG